MKRRLSWVPERGSSLNLFLGIVVFFSLLFLFYQFIALPLAEKKSEIKVWEIRRLLSSIERKKEMEIIALNDSLKIKTCMRNNLRAEYDKIEKADQMKVLRIRSLETEINKITQKLNLAKESLLEISNLNSTVVKIHLTI